MKTLNTGLTLALMITIFHSGFSQIDSEPGCDTNMFKVNLLMPNFS